MKHTGLSKLQKQWETTAVLGDLVRTLDVKPRKRRRSSVTVASALYECNEFGISEIVFDPDDLRKDHKLLVLHGGEDISPAIYGEIPEKTGAPPKPTKRDSIEMELAKRAWELQIPVLAICRGAQLVCAMLGGKLYQDAPFHAGQDHLLNIASQPGRRVMSNSYHHQMMIPVGGEILAYTGPATHRRFKKDAWVVEAIKEPEIVWWKDQRTLGVQGHPEWDHTPHGIYSYTKELLNWYFGGKK